MAKSKPKKLVTKTEAPKDGTVIVQEMRIVAPDRSNKDINDFKTAMINAEAVYTPHRARLYDLYTDNMLDGVLTGVIKKRIDAVLNKKIYYSDANGKRIDAFDKTIKSKVFRNIMEKIMETPGWGISGMEFIPGPKLKFKEIPRKHIKPEKKLLTFDQYGEDGIMYEGISNLWIVGEDKDLGYLLKCSPYVIYKRGNMGDWGQYIEIFGQPVRIIYYDAYDQKTKMELREVLDQSGSSLAMMIPKQAQFEMKDGKQSNGNGELQEKYKQACDEEIRMIVLCNTETTGSSKGSGYAQAKEHGKQQLDITKSDMEYVINYLNDDHFIEILKSYSLPIVEGGSFKFEKEIDVEALKSRIDIDTKIAGQKVPIEDDYWYETYGIPKPANYNELKAKIEAEKAIQNQPPPPEEDPAPPAPAKPEKKKNEKPPKPKQKENLKSDGFWFRLRAELANFFDPAP